MMAKEIKPIKRSKQLTPWSKDHHEGLLLVWKIRQGLKNGTDGNMVADYVRWFWVNHLDEHFREEEEMLERLAGENEMVQRMFDEHAQIKTLVHSEQLNTEVCLNEFADLLNGHIRFEERELFGAVEQLLSESELDKIEQHIKKDEAACPVWNDEFWLKK